MVGLRGHLFNLQTMYQFQLKLLYNGEEHFCTKAEFLNFNVALPFAKLDMSGSRLVSKDLIFSDNVLVNTQLVTFLLYSILVN